MGRTGAISALFLFFLVGGTKVHFVTPEEGLAGELEVVLTWPLDRLPKQLFRDFEKSSFHRVNRLTH